MARKKNYTSTQIKDAVLADQSLGTWEERLVAAARLGKIQGLRKARKLARQGRGVEDSIRNTYKALGVDTDAYEAEQKIAHPERYPVLVGGFGYDDQIS